MTEGSGAAKRWTALWLAAIGVVALSLLNLLLAESAVIGSNSPAGFAGHVGLLGVLLAVTFGARRRPNPYQVAFSVLLIAALYQFCFAEGRRSGDGFFYYAYVQSFWKDGDLDFDNEYRQYGIDDYPSVAVPTVTGKRRNNFSVGPALLWSPFFGLGEIVARVHARGDPSTDLSGAGPIHQRAVALATLLYGFAAAVLVYSLLTRYFRPASAFAGAALMWLATPLHWYMVYQPTMSHALSAFQAAWFLWYWDKHRAGTSSSRAFCLGVIGGIAILVRWQNAVLFLLPAIDLARSLVAHTKARDTRSVAAALIPGAWLAAGTLLAVMPQLIAWKSIFGVFLLTDPPQGPGYVRLTRPFALETLFSSRHGLLSWTPVVWLGFLGFVPLLRRAKAHAVPAGALLAVLAIMTYVNMCVGDWWGGGAFGARRFDAALPIFAFGIAASFGVLRRWIARFPSAVAAGVAIGFIGWNLLLTEQYRRYWIPPDDTVAFPEVVHGQAKLVTEHVGSPWSWPANWWFALRHGTAPERYDLLVGRYLFYRNNNLGGLMDLGQDDGAFLGDGWRRPEQREGVWARQIRVSEARLFVPLETPLSLRVHLHLSSRPDTLPVTVRINGSDAGRLAAEPGFRRHSIDVDASRWRAGINFLDLVLEKSSDDAFVLVDRIEFERK